MACGCVALMTLEHVLFQVGLPPQIRCHQTFHLHDTKHSN